MDPSRKKSLVISSSVLIGFIVLVAFFHLIQLASPMKNIHKRIMELMVILDKVCDRLHMEYWIEGGTLLGAVRDGSLIPWDDDADVSMKVEDCTKLYEQHNDMLKREFGVEVVWYGGIFGVDIYKLRFVGKVKYWVDIFPRRLDTSTGRYDIVGKSKEIWPTAYFEKESLDGYEMYTIGARRFRGPKNPTLYLERVYGDDWKTPKVTHFHTQEGFCMFVYKNRWFNSISIGIIIVLLGIIVYILTKNNKN